MLQVMSWSKKCRLIMQRVHRVDDCSHALQIDKSVVRYYGYSIFVSACVEYIVTIKWGSEKGGLQSF